MGLLADSDAGEDGRAYAVDGSKVSIGGAGMAMHPFWAGPRMLGPSCHRRGQAHSLMSSAR
jgi:hypothetical protein